MSDRQRRRVYRATRAGRHHSYLYGFLVSRDEGVRAPDDRMTKDPSKLVAPEGGNVRLELSVVGFKDFWSGRFNVDSTPPKINPPWRVRRHRQLQRFFDEVPVGRLELVHRLGDTLTDGLQAKLRPGGWFFISLTEDDRPSPVAGLLTFDDDTDGVPLTVRSFSRVSPFERRNLRDIFSLDHIGDFGGDDRGPELKTEPRWPQPGKTRPKPGGEMKVVVFGADRLVDVWSR